MSVFEEVPLEWKGAKYAIKPERVLKAVRLLEYMEPPFTLSHFTRFSQAGIFPQGTISEAYAILLRYVGVQATDVEVTRAMTSDASVMDAALNAVGNLFGTMLPTKEMQAAGKAEAASNQTGVSSPGSSSS